MGKDVSFDNKTMKSNKCVACKSLGKNRDGLVENVIWGKKNKCLSITLCYIHSLELFKTGQVRFLEIYKGSVETKDLEDKSRSNVFSFG